MRAAVAVALSLAGCEFQSGVTTRDAAIPDGIIDGIPIDAPPRLAGRGLLVRYFMDEAGSGQLPTQLVDSTATPLNLPITYTSNLAYTGPDGHRGLVWTSPAGTDGRADIALQGTKIATQLGSKVAWTIEVVVDVQAVSPPGGTDTRLIAIGTGTANYGTAALVVSDLTHVTLSVNGVTTTWLVDARQGRHVITAVVNTQAAT